MLVLLLMVAFIMQPCVFWPKKLHLLRICCKALPRSGPGVVSGVV